MQPGGSSRSLARTMSVPAAAIAVNGLAYLLLLLAARRLTHAAYGEFATALGVLLVGTIPALAVQTVTARRIAASERTAGIAAATAVLGLGSATVLVGLTAPLDRFLHFASPATLLWVAAALVGTTCLGPVLGHAQGHSRFGALAVATIVQGVGRSAGGLAGLLIGRTPAAACAGVAIGLACAAVVGVVILRRAGAPLARGRATRGALRSVLTEAMHAAHGHGSFLVLAGLDLILARHVLSTGAAGLYAAGTVVERAALWLPQSIGLLVFARLASHDRHHRIVRRTGVLIIAIGLAMTGVVAVANHLVVTVIGGNYAGLARVGWLFAVIGSAQAVAQFSMLAGLALQRSRRVTILWSMILVEIAVVLVLGSSATVTTVVGVTAAITVMGAAAIFAAAAHSRTGRATHLVPDSLAAGGAVQCVTSAQPVPVRRGGPGGGIG